MLMNQQRSHSRCGGHAASLESAREDRVGGVTIVLTREGVLRPTRRRPVTEAAIIQEPQEGRWRLGREKIDLVLFCGVSALADYAPRKIARCARLLHVKGIETHFANAGVDLKNPEHVAKVRRFFRAANANRRRTCQPI